MRLALIALAALLCAGAPAQVQAQGQAPGDPAKGKKVFNKCAICHSIGASDAETVGLDLAGVYGRRVAAVPDFSYSEGLVAFAADGKVWDEATLAAFLADPETYVPKTNMAFVGLKREDEIRHILAYLKTFSAAAPSR